MNPKFLALLTLTGMVAETLLLRGALDYLPVSIVGTFSRVFTVSLMAAWVLTRGDGWRRLKPRGVVRWLALMGVNAIAINILLFLALKGRTTATNYALLYRLDVVFVILIGTILGLERIGWRELLLLPLMLVGVACVAEVRPSKLEPHLVGDLMVIGAAFGFAVNAFVLRRIFKAMETEAVALINVSITAGGFLGMMLITGQWADMGPRAGEPAGWLLAAVFGVIFGVYLMLYYATLKRMPVWKLRMWMLCTPGVVAAADWMLWDTRLSIQQWIGMGLVLAGLAGLIHLERNGTFLLSRQPPPDA